MVLWYMETNLKQVNSLKSLLSLYFAMLRQVLEEWPKNNKKREIV